MIGRNTRGGLVITSSPLWPELTASTSGEALGVGDGDVDGEAEGDGEDGGVGVGAPCRVKVAHGGDWFRPSAEPHSLCTPGLLPGDGLTLVGTEPPQPGAP